MVLEERCKLVVQGITWRVNMCDNPGGNSPCYRVMRMRNIAKGGSFFRDERTAIRFMLRECYIELGSPELITMEE